MRTPPRFLTQAIVVGFSVVLLAAPGILVVPVDIQEPGTQPNEVNNLGLPSQCDNCHGGYDPVVEPNRTWRQSMMAQAGRDPLFWAAVAVAEQDFPGAGDLCLRCHAPRGWSEGRSAPTDGSGLANSDDHGVECAICHKMVNPDGSEHLGVQNAPYIANNEANPAVGYYGGGSFVLRAGNDRLGPYADAGAAPHGFLQSMFHRSSDFCGTCHDVSNPLVGDIAHNNGAQTPLPPGSFVGTLGGAIQNKAAFKNFPYQYGIVERTFSEHKASLLSSTPVSAYSTLPANLQAGSIAAARTAALEAGQNGNYADGTTRAFTCQTCHLVAATGKGAVQSDAPIRTDLPRHDMIGGNTWLADAIEYLNAQGRLVIGNGMTALELAALNEGQVKAEAVLDLAAGLIVEGNTLMVVNRTGHKLISGYPEGRRMWLNVKWYDAASVLIREDGAYGTLTVTLPAGTYQVASILDLTGPNTRIYEAKHGLTKEWASELVSLGLPYGLVLSYDRMTGAPGLTLGQLAAMPAGSTHESFHFALSNILLADNRIPPYGMSRNIAAVRNVLPVPSDQYGNPPPGGIYRYWDEVPLAPPPGAVTASIQLLYQTTSYEYVQFLKLANTGGGSFLGTTGDDLFEAWLNTGMAAPHVMASTTWTASCATPASAASYGAGWPGTLGVPALTASAPPVIGTTITISAGNSLGTPALAVLIAGYAPAAIPTTLGGTVLASPDATMVVTLPSPALLLPVSLPPDPIACGASLYVQVVEVDRGASAGYSFSPGLALRLGH